MSPPASTCATRPTWSWCSPPPPAGQPVPGRYGLGWSTIPGQLKTSRPGYAPAVLASLPSRRYSTCMAACRRGAGRPPERSPRDDLVKESSASGQSHSPNQRRARRQNPRDGPRSGTHGALASEQGVAVDGVACPAPRGAVDEHPDHRRRPPQHPDRPMEQRPGSRPRRSAGCLARSGHLGACGLSRIPGNSQHHRCPVAFQETKSSDARQADALRREQPGGPERLHRPRNRRRRGGEHGDHSARKPQQGQGSRIPAGTAHSDQDVILQEDS